MPAHQQQGKTHTQLCAEEWFEHRDNWVGPAVSLYDRRSVVQARANDFYTSFLKPKHGFVETATPGPATITLRENFVQLVTAMENIASVETLATIRKHCPTFNHYSRRSHMPDPTVIELGNGSIMTRNYWPVDPGL